LAVPKYVAVATIVATAAAAVKHLTISGGWLGKLELNNSYLIFCCLSTNRCHLHRIVDDNSIVSASEAQLNTIVHQKM
jgi:hypothetical protein